MLHLHGPGPPSSNRFLHRRLSSGISMSPRCRALSRPVHMQSYVMRSGSWYISQSWGYLFSIDCGSPLGSREGSFGWIRIFSVSSIQWYPVADQSSATWSTRLHRPGHLCFQLTDIRCSLWLRSTESALSLCRLSQLLSPPQESALMSSRG